MKYLGEKSLSSFLSAFLRVAWYVVLVGAIIGSILMLCLILVTHFIYFYSEGAFPCAADNGQTALELSEARQGIEGELAQDKDLRTFFFMPLPVKLLVLPYAAGVMILLLIIIKKAHAVFYNFKRNIIFDRQNVKLIDRLGKLMIIFGIITFDFSTLIAAVLILILCEIFKNGAQLQEEQDYTV